MEKLLCPSIFCDLSNPSCRIDTWSKGGQGKGVLVINKRYHAALSKGSFLNNVMLILTFPGLVCLVTSSNFKFNESIFLGVLKEDLFYFFLKNNFSEIFIFTILLILYF